MTSKNSHPVKGVEPMLLVSFDHASVSHLDEVGPTFPRFQCNKARIVFLKLLYLVIQKRKQADIPELGSVLTHQKPGPTDRILSPPTSAGAVESGDGITSARGRAFGKPPRSFEPF